MVSSFLWVGLGGAFGAIARVGLERFLPAFLLSIPIKIFCINVLGCFLIGVLTAFMAFHGNFSMNMRHFLVQGFLGGFTTFSAFALEFGLLYEKGSRGVAITYAFLSVVLTILFFFLGIRVVKLVT